MKLNLFFNCGAVGAVTAIAALGVLTPATALAQGSSVQAQDVASSSVTIQVPADGSSVTYLVNGEEEVIEVGESRQIPANATQIQLSPGVVINAVRELPSGGFKTTTFKIVHSFQFASLKPKDVRRALVTNEENIAEVDVFRTLPNGDIVRIPKERSLLLELVQLSTVIQQNAADSATTSSVGNTDGRR